MAVWHSCDGVHAACVADGACVMRATCWRMAMCSTCPGFDRQPCLQHACVPVIPSSNTNRPQQRCPPASASPSQRRPPRSTVESSRNRAPARCAATSILPWWQYRGQLTELTVLLSTAGAQALLDGCERWRGSGGRCCGAARRGQWCQPRAAGRRARCGPGCSWRRRQCGIAGNDGGATRWARHERQSADSQDQWHGVHR